MNSFLALHLNFRYKNSLNGNDLSILQESCHYSASEKIPIPQYHYLILLFSATFRHMYSAHLILNMQCKMRPLDRSQQMGRKQGNLEKLNLEAFLEPCRLLLFRGSLNTSKKDINKNFDIG